MQLKCYLCDSEITGAPHTFKIGVKEELICNECHVKSVNRRKALEGESGGSVKQTGGGP